MSPWHTDHEPPDPVLVERLRDKILPNMTCEIVRERANEAADEIERLRDALRAAMALDPGVEADAARWRYVRDRLAFLVAHYRDKSALWSVRDPGHEPGLTFEETIDKLIAKEQHAKSSVR